MSHSFNKIVFDKFIDVLRTTNIEDLSFVSKDFKKQMKSKFGVEKLQFDVDENGVSRKMLFEICNNSNIDDIKQKIFSVFVWGGIHKKNATLILGNSIDEILECTKKLQNVKSREEAYNCFWDKNLSGLGPAFYTKLMFFFRRDLNCYIMDQWTSRSINLLMFGKSFIVRLGNNQVSEKNKASDYYNYCKKVDELTVEVNKVLNKDFTGSDIELFLFSHGGKKKGDWRSYVIENT